jgi:hypothetical protein
MPSGSGSPTSSEGALGLFASEAGQEPFAAVPPVVLPIHSAASPAPSLLELSPAASVLGPRPLGVEPFVAEAEGLTVSSSMPPVSIADLPTSGIALQRAEAVAIVRGICRAILDSQEPATDPELNRNHAFINPDGTVSLTSRPHPEAALHGVRRLLLEMLPPHEFVVAKALPDGSLEEFYEALEYYVGSDPVLAIKNVRRRWRPERRLPAVMASVEKPVAAAGKWTRLVTRFGWLRIGRLRPIRLRFGRLRLDRFRFDWFRFNRFQFVRRRPFRLLVAGAILVATSAGLLALTLRNRQVVASVLSSGFEVASPVASAELTPSKPPAASPSPAPSSRRSIASPRSSAQATSAKGTPSIAGTARVESSQLRPVKPDAPPSRPRNQTAKSTVPSREAFGLGGSSVTLSKLEAPARSAPSKTEPAESSAAATVYDFTQRDIVPPQFIYPLLPGPLPSVPARTDVPAIEVIINEQGTIDRVQASIPPRTIAEAVKMLGQLSAAKTWRFRPALISGQPVKYRLVVPLTLF